MKNIFLFLLTSFLYPSVLVKAQLSTLAGKTWTINSKIQGTVSIQSPMGEMDIPSASDMQHELTIKQIVGASVKGVTVLKKITGSTSIMGQETKFDSDDKTIMNNPQVAEMFKSLKKEETFILENKKTKTESTITAAVSITGNELAGIFLLPFSDAALKHNYEWKEVINDGKGTKATISNRITQISATEVVIEATTQADITGTVKQFNMEVKQNMKGTIKAIRTYNRQTGLLVQENKLVDLTGNNQMMGQEMPMKMRGTIISVVK